MCRRVVLLGQAVVMVSHCYKCACTRSVRNLIVLHVFILVGTSRPLAMRTGVAFAAAMLQKDALGEMHCESSGRTHA
jgi:hypothetical protein